MSEQTAIIVLSVFLFMFVMLTVVMCCSYFDIAFLKKKKNTYTRVLFDVL